MLLLARMGAQSIDWPPELLDALIDAGHRVLVYDSRGFGESPAPEPYGFDALVDDALSVLDAAAVDRVHLVGSSMGGVVARGVFDRDPGRVRSLTLMSTSTGDGTIPVWTPEFERVVATPPTAERSSIVDYLVAERRAMSDGRFDEVRVRVHVERAADRGWSMRSLRLVAKAMHDRWEHLVRPETLAAIDVPTLVVHGTSDAVLPLPHGDSLHAAVPGSRYVVVDGMNHDLQAHHVAEVVGVLLEHLGAAPP